MTSLEGFQILVAAVSLLGSGFAVGNGFGRRNRSNQSLNISFDAIRSVMSGIKVQTVRVLPETAPIGAQVAIEFDVTSDLSTSVELWLGADIEYEPGKHFYDVAQDKVVWVEPGRGTYTRYLTLALPLTPRLWPINTGIWFGKKSDPDRSIRLVLKSIDLYVTS
jgi:hypothetical protein